MGIYHVEVRRLIEWDKARKKNIKIDDCLIGSYH